MHNRFSPNINLYKKSIYVNMHLSIHLSIGLVAMGEALRESAANKKRQNWDDRKYCGGWWEAGGSRPGSSSIFHVVANWAVEARQVMMSPPCKNNRAMTGTCLWLAPVQDGDRRTLCCSSAWRTWEGPLGGSTHFIPVLLFYNSPDEVQVEPDLSLVSSGLQCVL